MSVCLVGMQQNRIDFSGRWELDFRRSVGLSDSFDEVQSHVVNVTQTADSMLVRVEETTDDGKTVKLSPIVFRFDSTSVYQNDTLQGIQRWIRSTWATTGQKLIVSNRALRVVGSDTFQYSQIDVWQFSNTKTLMVITTQTFEHNDSTHVELRYYRRVP